MTAQRTSNFGRLLGVVLAMVVLVLAGCGGGGSGTTKVNVTVGSKKDADGQLLGAMYGLLLANQGYNVTYKLAAGDTTFLDSAIKSGNVDVYPEFTGTALTVYKLQGTQDPQQAYTTVKNYYEQQFKLTWLAPAYNLNDSYGICTNQANATRFSLHSVADIASSQNNGNLKIASQDDGITAAINPVKTGYNIRFKQVVSLQEQLSFDAVNHGDVDLMVCYTSDPHIASDNFVLLTDPKGVFPIYNPAPVVRDTILSANPTIQTTLDALETHLTTDKQVALIKQVSLDTKDPKDVAKTFLQSEGLLPTS